MSPDQLQQQFREEGFCVLPSVLSPQELQAVRSAVDSAMESTRRSGVAPSPIDPNSCNVRLYNLPESNPVFIELLRHPVALDMVKRVLGPHFLISNFAGNVAPPGSGSMMLHSDQATTVPPPWIEPWATQVIWCVDDVHERNGATRYVPRSWRYQRFEAVPADAISKTVAFEAPAGSAIVMEGRLWHTSGANVTKDERRAMLFA